MKKFRLGKPQIYIFLKIFILLLLSIILKVNSVLGYTSSSTPAILKIEYGARTISMGGAGVALFNNLFYIDSNPAGGMFYRGYRFALLHQEWIYDTNYESARLFAGFRRFYLGLGINYMYTPFTYYDIFGLKNGSSYTISQYLGTLNFGYRFFRINLSAGINIKYYYYNVPQSLYKNQNYSLVLADIGLMLPTNALKNYVGYQPSMVFGMVLKNIGYNSYSNKFPSEIDAGISYRYKKYLLFNIQINIPFNEPISFSFGAEYTLLNKIYIAGGINIGEIPYFGFGVGYRKKDFRVRITYSPSIRFFNMLNAEISYSFGETNYENNMEKIEKLFIKALKYFSEKDYENSLRMIADILKIDPKNYWAERLMKVINQQLEIQRKLEEIEKMRNG